MTVLVPRIMKLRTDDLTRHPETQVREQADQKLIAEYAIAMIEGTTFPPVVVFEDESGDRYLADGYHRVDAAALAALKVKGRKAEVLAEIRPGSMDDAIRYALQANHVHGKRLREADYRKAYGMMVDRDLLRSIPLKRVVDEVRSILGCSRQLATELSLPTRNQKRAERNQRIAEMHAAGRSQEAIGKALKIGQQTVSDVLSRITESATGGKTGEKPDPPAAPVIEKREAVAPDPKSQVSRPGQGKRPAYKIDVSPLLPLLGDMAVDDEDDDDAGEIPPAVQRKPHRDAINALRKVERVMAVTLKSLAELDGLKSYFDGDTAAPALDAIETTTGFLADLRDYIEGGTTP
jgi:ParB-like chromosome segregation protein Spo0J